MVPYEYAYLFADLVLMLPIWVLVLFFRPDLRKEILTTSSFGGIIALVTAPIFLRDYWHPALLFNLPVGIEDFLFGFFALGIASSLYEEFYGKRFTTRKDRSLHWSFITIVSFLSIFLLLLLLTIGFGVNSIYASEVALILWSAVMLYFRHDLFIDSVMSALIFGAVYLVLFIIFLKIFPSAIAQFWYVRNLSQIFLLGIPIEEIIYGFVVGLAVGPLYEFTSGLKLKDHK